MAELAIDQLTVEYDSGGYKLRPIDQFDLTAETGSLILLLGPSGCGKTTLLSCLAGLMAPTSGSIRYDDLEVIGLEGKDLIAFRQKSVGVVFQAFNLVASLTAQENVAVPLWTAGWSRRKGMARAAELLDQVGLSERVTHHPNQLSGGQQQRVAIARALALDPPVLLADEPTAHLDHLQVEGVLRLLRSLAVPGRLVIVATHDDRLIPLADQLVSLTPHTDTTGHGKKSRVELAVGDVLFQEGDASDLIYLVESGSIALRRERSEGGFDELAVRTEGEHFGEMGPLFSLPRSATALATSPSVVTGYTVRGFREMVGVANLPDLVRTFATPASTD